MIRVGFGCDQPGYLRPIEARLLVSVGSTIHRYLLATSEVRNTSTIGLRSSHAESHIGPALDGTNAAGVRKMIRATRRFIHAVSGFIRVAYAPLAVRVSNLLGLLNASLRIGQVARPCWVSTTDRALLKVTFQNVTSRKCIGTKHTLVRAVAGVMKEMTLYVLCVDVSFGAVRTRKLAFCILEWCDVALCASSAGISGWAPGRS